MIFSKGRGGKHSRTGDTRPAGRYTGPGDAGPEPAEVEPDDAAARGPYDITEAPAGVARVDLGSLHIPVVDGVEFRVQADPNGTVSQVVLVHGDSAMQLGVFAAPRTEGIWSEIRAEIRESLAKDGAQPKETTGEYGTELRARLRTPEGPSDIRFIGVDGPRWMVRAVYQGKAAVDPAAEGPLAQCLHGLVVDRGREAMPVRDPLPLRLPKEFAGPDGEGTATAGS